MKFQASAPCIMCSNWSRISLSARRPSIRPLPRGGGHVVGELGTTTPKSVKIYGDISGELVNVGRGTAQDFEGKDLKGKFVLSLAPSGLGGVYNRAVAAGLSVSRASARSGPVTVRRTTLTKSCG
jgi:hypothetical protein